MFHCIKFIEKNNDITKILIKTNYGYLDIPTLKVFQKSKHKQIKITTAQFTAKDINKIFKKI